MKGMIFTACLGMVDACFSPEITYTAAAYAQIDRRNI
jgi:hypothetical protein